MVGPAEHQPLFENSKQGKLRTKVENGECSLLPACWVAPRPSVLSHPGAPGFLSSPRVLLWWDLKRARNKDGVSES